METKHGPPWTRQNGYETLDYILAQNTLKKTIKNAEVDIEFIDSDHYPVIADIVIKLKAKPMTSNHSRIKYGTNTDKQTLKFNTKIGNAE